MKISIEVDVSDQSQVKKAISILSNQLTDSKPATPKPVAPEPKTAEPSVKQSEDSITITEVRAKVKELISAKKRDEVIKIFKSFGADNVKSLPEDKYAEFIEAANQL